MKEKILKRIGLFLGLTLFTFFVPWQVSVLLLLSVALFLEAPIEYVFLVIGIFGGGVFAVFWATCVFFGIFIKQKTRLGTRFV